MRSYVAQSRLINREASLGIMTLQLEGTDAKITESCRPPQRVQDERPICARASLGPITT